MFLYLCFSLFSLFQFHLKIRNFLFWNNPTIASFLIDLSLLFLYLLEEIRTRFYSVFPAFLQQKSKKESNFSNFPRIRKIEKRSEDFRKKWEKRKRVFSCCIFLLWKNGYSSQREILNNTKIFWSFSLHKKLLFF